MIPIKEIILLDQNNNKIGSLYPRRAKQLVIKNKARWVIEGQTLQMILDVTDSSPTIKEETKMTHENSNNPAPAGVTYAPELVEPDALLLYKAKENVRNKRNLLKHFLAYIVAWPVLGIFYQTVISILPHPHWERIQRGVSTSNHWEATNFINNVSSYFTRLYTPPFWYVLMGVMLAWGCWIFYRLVKYYVPTMASKIRRVFIKTEKPDPVEAEYNRLKGL